MKKFFGGYLWQILSGLMVFSFFSVFFVHSAFSASENALYAEIDKSLSEIETEISSAEHTGKMCEFAFGFRAKMQLRQSSITFIDTIMDVWEGQEKSLCLSADTNSIDTRIVRAMENFQKTKASCGLEESEKFEAKMKIIIEKRRKLRFETSKKEYSKENCEENPHEKIFSETMQAWNSFQEKLKNIEKAMKELRKSSFSPSEMQNKEIDRVATENAQMYYDQFWSGLDVAAGMREARAKVNRSLKGLPSGKSTFVQVENTMGKKNEALNKIPEKKSAYQKTQWDNAEPLLESRAEILKRIATEEKMFQNAFDTHIKMLEQTEDFSSPLSTAIIDSLSVFHQTTNQTKFHFDALTEALSGVVSAQNLEK